MKRSLYTEQGHYTDDGMRTSEEIRRFVQQLFESKVAEGHSPRELGAIGHAAIEEAVTELMLDMKGPPR